MFTRRTGYAHSLVHSKREVYAVRSKKLRRLVKAQVFSSSSLIVQSTARKFSGCPKNVRTTDVNRRAARCHKYTWHRGDLLNHIRLYAPWRSGGGAQPQQLSRFLPGGNGASILFTDFNRAFDQGGIRWREGIAVKTHVVFQTGTRMTAV